MTTRFARRSARQPWVLARWPFLLAAALACNADGCSAPLLSQVLVHTHTDPMAAIGRAQPRGRLLGQLPHYLEASRKIGQRRARTAVAFECVPNPSGR